MAVSKVNYGDDTLIDLTEDTVTPSNLMKGATAHDSAGNIITGVLETTEITTTLSAESTNVQVPGAKCVYDAIQTSSVQSDYDQNDSSQSDYIKNRTHYKEIVHQEEVDLLPETKIDFPSLGDKGYTQAEPLNVKVGDTVKVLWDNQEYECKAQLMPQGESSWPDDIIVFGNLYAVGIDDISTSETPFSVVSNYLLSESGFVSGCTISPIVECTNPITVRIFTGGDKVVYHKLDVNYLPISEGDISSNDNNIVTSKPLIKYFSANRSDWDVDDIMDPRFIKNRPFYRRIDYSNVSLPSRTITLDENGIYNSLDELYNFDNIVDNLYGDMNLTVHWHDGTYNCTLRKIYEYWVDEYGDGHTHTHFVFGNVSDIDNDYSSDSAPFLIYLNYNPETKKTGETYIKAYDGFAGELNLQVDAEYRCWSYNKLDNKYLDIYYLQSNWDEENDSSPRYIGNKPFFKNKISDVNIDSISKNLEFNESGVYITQDSFFNLQEHFYDFNPVSSSDIFVNCNWNGAEYKYKVRRLTCEYYDSDKGSNIVDYYYAFGNVSSIDNNYSDTAPFLVYANYNPETHQNGETYIVSQDKSIGTIPFYASWVYDYWHYNPIDNRYLNLSTNVSQGNKNPVTGDAVYNSIDSVKGMIPSVPSWAMQSNKPSYSASEVGADASGTATSEVSTHNTNTSAHNDLRLELKGLSDRLNALANSDDTTLDQMSEIVTYIKNNRSLIENVTTTKVNVTDIIDNLTTNVSNKPLSAAQGVALKSLIDAITVPTSLSQLSEDTNHRLVTDSEKTTWNSKLDLSATNNAIKSFFGGKTVVFSDTPPTNNDQNVITFVKRG